MQGQRVEAKRRNRGRGGSSWILVLLALIIGIAIGFAIAYFTVDVVNATPGDLGYGSKQIWIDMTADSYQVTENLEAAQRRLSLDRAENAFFSPEELAALFANRIQAAEKAGELGRAEWLKKLAGELSITPQAAPAGEDGASADPAADENMFNTILMACGGVFSVVVVLGLIAVLWTRSRQNKGKTRPRAINASTRNRATVAPPPDSKASNARASAPPPPPAPVSAPPVPSPVAADPFVQEKIDETKDALDRLFDEAQKAAEEAPADKTLEIDFSESDAPPVRYSPPLDEFRTRYNYGDDGYDMSFSIETPKSEFLGECGVGISETINKGTPQQATAFEVWLFDKDDIRTVTKVLLSEHAWSNETLRQRLAPKGELIVVKENETIDLETKSLRVRARIREMEYGSQSVHSNSYFERLVIELTPQQKQQ